MTTFAASADLLRAVVDHLWQSTLFVAAAALLAWLTRKTHPRAQIWIWLAASVKFWIPFAALFALGSWAGRQTPMAVPLDATRVAPYVVVQLISEPFSGIATPRDVDAGPATDHAFAWVAILCLSWACGALVISWRWLRRWQRITRLTADATVATTGREVAALVRASVDMRVATPPRIALTNTSIEPGVLGVTRMTLLWPLGLSEHLDDEQLYAVMLHELSHARRRDNLIAAGQMVVEVVFWFWPVVWWVGSRLVDARELACDEDVVRFSRAPSAYAASLLKTCQYCLQSPLDCVPGVTGSELKGRIEAIMRSRVANRLTLRRKVLITSVIAASLVAPLVAGGVKGAVTNVWQGAVSLPNAAVRPEVPFAMRLPNPPSIDDAFRMAAVRAAVPVKSVDVSPAPTPVVSAQSAASGETGQAQPVDAFRIGAPDVVKSLPAGGIADSQDPTRNPELEGVLRSGQPRTDLSLSVTVNFRQLNVAEYLVPIGIRIAPGSDLIAGRGKTSRLDFLARVEDSNGIIYETLRDTVDLTLGPASIAELATKPIIYQAALKLLPGHYTLKVLARDQTTGRIGTSEATFTIPNLDKLRQAQ